MLFNNPEYAKIGETKYKINTDYRIGLKCQEIATNTEIGDMERALAIIYLVFGDKGLEDKDNHEKLLELAIRYLGCDEEVKKDDDKPDMDLVVDFRLIEASFRSDYGITLSKEEMHWWDFINYLNGLTENCVLNRVRNIRNFNLDDIKDIKEKNKMKELKKRFELKQKERPLTEKQKESVDKFYELTGISRKE